MKSGERPMRVCSECGSKIVEYTFTFNRGLLAVLKKLYEAGGPVKMEDLDLTYSQRTNCQKLRYWDLAEPVLNGESRVKRGYWQITEFGREFLRSGKAMIPIHVVMCRNKFVRYEGRLIAPWHVDASWDYYRTYANQASAQLGATQARDLLI